jgi:3-deoxy-manno-octulosonate cytidylyltransferase (CMP-KDO synthetase)
MKIACIIPARLLSKRFPRKILAPLLGKPLLQHVWEKAISVPLFDSVSIALDSPETAEIASKFGARFFMTSELCESGTARVIELQKKIDADIFVNWQGDEPFIDSSMIEDLLQSCHLEGADVWTLKKKITSQDETLSPHIVKVVTDSQGFALYFSRHPIPYARDDAKPDYFKHIGLYAYTRDALIRLSSLPPSPLEQSEKLEQLTFLYHGLKIRLHETKRESLGVDLPEHLDQASSFLKAVHSRQHGRDPQDTNALP